MLYDSDDKENKSNDSKLFGADNANSNLDDSPAAEGNPDSLFASPLNGTNQTSSHDSLFDTSFSEDDIKANDTIDSSFVVSFKNNDPINSVSDKLKYDNSFDGMDYEDDLADFDFDSSISAFKPLNAPVVDDPKPATPEVKEEKIEEKVEEVKEEVKEEINDLDQQIDEPIDKPIFAPKAATASSAKDLDFAASESTKSSSSFSGHAPVEEPKPFSPVEDNISDDVETKEEVSPFVPKNEAPVEDKVEESAPVAEAAAAAAVASTVADFASEPAKEELSPDQKAFEAFKSSTKQSKPQKDKLEGVQTYGKVSSGVDAFGKSTNAASVEQRAPVKRQANNVRPGAGKQEAAPAAVKRPPRQSTSNSTPFGSTNERRIPPTQRKSAASQTGNIQPVTTVETKKKKTFGVGSIIAAVVLFLILVVVIIGLMFGSKITDYFKGISGTSTTKTSRHHDDDDDEETAVTSIISESKSDPTESTDDTTTEATTTTEETTTEATTTEATTTEATTTEATTTEETTTEATTTEATTEATTTEATTTEATTTEATTTETTKKPSNGGGAVTTFYTSMSGFTSNDSGFTCNLVLENYGSKDAQLKDSVNSVKITFNSDKTITNVTSDYFTFEAVPDTKNTFIGTPTSATIEAGEKFKAPITVSTDGKPSHYGYTSCYFDWNK
ncbi:MAG: hypothetical protein K6G47_04665 [Clostridia bacterium]|nr:hypothetical protein [Clostridia bacterium]